MIHSGRPKLIVCAILLGASPVALAGCGTSATGSNPFPGQATGPTILEVGSSISEAEAIVYVRVDDLPVHRAGRVTAARGFTTILRGVAQGPRSISNLVISVAPRRGPQYRLGPVLVEPGDMVRVHVGPSQMSSEIAVFQGR